MSERVREYRILGPRQDDRLVATLRTFAVTYRPSVEAIYYPGCGIDSSPSVAFPESMVLYADKNIECIVSLRESGFYAMLLDAEAFAPVVPVDLLLIVNSPFNPRAAIECLRPGGYFLCHRFGGAGDADSIPGLQRIGTVGGDVSSLSLHIFERYVFRPIG